MNKLCAIIAVAALAVACHRPYHQGTADQGYNTTTGSDSSMSDTNNINSKGGVTTNGISGPSGRGSSSEGVNDTVPNF